MTASISVVVPTYTLTEELEVMAYNCAKTYREFADEVIITEDAGRRSMALLDIADTYVYHDENLGFTRNLNVGWKLATKDFVFLVNSDTYIDYGDPQNLCIPGKVTSPYMQGHTRGNEFLNGAFFVVPKEVQKERGMLNEKYITYYSDDDYHDRVADIFQHIESVIIRHAFGATISRLPLEWRDKETERDRSIYEKERDK